MKFLERSPGTTPQGYGAWGCAYRERSAKPITGSDIPFRQRVDIDEGDRTKRDDSSLSSSLDAFSKFEDIRKWLLYLREPLDLRGLEEARLLEVLPGKSSKQITHITADKFQPPRRGGESSRCLCFQELCGGASESLPDRENRNWDTQVIPGGFP
ncbi:hypothetical protein G5I_13766 [Acromyrmex echinatior]|uniref:Uncharacterized protein n=1 Tax=Acromyrmex echinatior TaxID=103372 RepID=F4X5X3_ACREC|nr:hypothetical protein G5I_13766 [Acromyrmex echinatior]